MSDKLEWLNRHFALLRCSKLDEAVSDEKYECQSDLAEFYKKQSVEDIIWNMADAGKYKEASELMGYVGHHRAVIWWGYQCLLSMYEEFKINPPSTVDIDHIGKSFEPEVPDFAKVEEPKPTPEEVELYEQNMKEVDENLQKLREMCDPEALEEFESMMDVFYEEFESVYGKKPFDLIKDAQKAFAEEVNDGIVDMNSPLFQECKKIEDQIQQVRQDTLDTIHTVLPPENREAKIKKARSVLETIYSWVLAPDEINAKDCLDAGNTCPDLPVGILAYCAFWAWGDMMAGQEGNFVVKAPAGLMSNGFGKFLLMCALFKGGTRKVKERYEEYFKIGVDVLTGKNLWDKNAISGEIPHEALLAELQRNSKEGFIPVKRQEPVESETSLDEFERQVTSQTRMTGRVRNEQTPVAPKKYSRWKPDNT